MHVQCRRFTCFMGLLQVKAFSQSVESFRTAIVVGGTNIADQVTDFGMVFHVDYMIVYLNNCCKKQIFMFF